VSSLDREVDLSGQILFKLKKIEAMLSYLKRVDSVTTGKDLETDVPKDIKDIAADAKSVKDNLISVKNLLSKYPNREGFPGGTESTILKVSAFLDVKLSELISPSSGLSIWISGEPVKSADLYSKSGIIYDLNEYRKKKIQEIKVLTVVPSDYEVRMKDLFSKNSKSAEPGNLGTDLKESNVDLDLIEDKKTMNGSIRKFYTALEGGTSFVANATSELSSASLKKTLESIGLSPEVKRTWSEYFEDSKKKYLNYLYGGTSKSCPK
jgi:hypothetical protein